MRSHTHDANNQCKSNSYPLSHSLNPVPELVDHVTHLQGFAATVVVEVLPVSHDVVEVGQGISPSCQQPQNHLSQFLPLHEQPRTLSVSQ